MVVWLLQHVIPFLQQVESHTSGTSRIYTTFRIASASLMSFLIAVLLGPYAIRWLRRRFREKVASASTELDNLHKSKNHTPTMGGLFVVSACLVSLFIWGDWQNHFVQMGVFVVISFAMLGAYDDWTKQSHDKRGLSARSKFIIQWILALMAGASLCNHFSHLPDSTDVISPVGGYRIALGWGWMIWGAFVLVGSSNAVNLTDGLDGLAGGCSIFSGGVLIALCYLAGHKTLAEYLAIPYVPRAGEMAVVLGALLGAILGFLWYNCHPASVFMGDTGSLPIGAILGLAALVCRQELLYILIGGVFVAETLSVILQIGIYRWTGKRILRCSPLHNHFVLQGHAETKVVTRFWIVSALSAIASLASLKIL